MKYLSALLCLSIAALAAADFGYYIPRAVYTIDEFGRQSPLTYINSIPEAFHRARRQINPQGFPNFGQPLFPFPQIPIGAPGTSYTGISSSVSSGDGGVLSSRFGDDGSGVSGHTTTTVVKDGVGVTTTHSTGGGGGVSVSSTKGSPGYSSYGGVSNGVSSGVSTSSLGGHTSTNTLSSRFGDDGGVTTYHSTGGGGTGSGIAVSSVSGGPSVISPVPIIPSVPNYGFGSVGGGYGGSYGGSYGTGGGVGISTTSVGGQTLTSRFGDDGTGTVVTHTSGGVGGFPSPFVPLPDYSGLGVPGFGSGIGFGSGVSSGGAVSTSSVGGTGGGVSTIQTFNSGSPTGTLANRFGEENPNVTGQITTTVIKDGQTTTTVQSLGPNGKPGKPVVVSSSGNKKKPSTLLSNRFGEQGGSSTGSKPVTSGGIAPIVPFTPFPAFPALGFAPGFPFGPGFGPGFGAGFGQGFGQGFAPGFGNGVATGGVISTGSTGGTNGGVSTIQTITSGSPSGGTLANRFGEEDSSVVGQITTTVIKDGEKVTTVQDIGADGKPSKPHVVSSSSSNSANNKKPSGGLASRFGEDGGTTGQTVTTVIKDGQSTTTTQHVNKDGSVNTYVQKGRTY